MPVEQLVCSQNLKKCMEWYRYQIDWSLDTQSHKPLRLLECHAKYQDFFNLNFRTASMHLRHSLKKSMPSLQDFVCCCCCCCCCCFFFLSLSAPSFIGGFHVTSSPPCWWTVNKRLLISSLCLSTSICSFHHCYLCLPRLHENHLYHSSPQTTLQWSKFG